MEVTGLINQSRMSRPTKQQIKRHAQGPYKETRVRGERSRKGESADVAFYVFCLLGLV